MLAFLCRDVFMHYWLDKKIFSIFKSREGHGSSRIRYWHFISSALDCCRSILSFWYKHRNVGREISSQKIFPSSVRFNKWYVRRISCGFALLSFKVLPQWAKHHSGRTSSWLHKSWWILCAKHWTGFLEASAQVWNASAKLIGFFKMLFAK